MLAQRSMGEVRCESAAESFNSIGAGKISLDPTQLKTQREDAKGTAWHCAPIAAVHGVAGEIALKADDAVTKESVLLCLDSSGRLEDEWTSHYLILLPETQDVRQPGHRQGWCWGLLSAQEQTGSPSLEEMSLFPEP